MALVSTKIAPDFPERLQWGAAMALATGATIWIGGWWLAVGLCLVGALAMFEWARLCRGQHVGFGLVMTMSMASVAMLYMLGSPNLIIPSLGGWVLVQLIVRTVHRTENMPLLILGNLAISIMVWSLLTLSQTAPQPWLLVWLVAVVTTSDTCAYIVGRIVRGPRMSPRISPGKTWSGLIGGMAGAACVGGVLAYSLDGAATLGVFMGSMMGLLGQVGDLGISAIKRKAGVKDSSCLIPGHGGVLDRTDSMVLTAPVFTLLCTVLRIPPL